MIESVTTIEELKQLERDENYTVFCEEDENYYQYKKNGEWIIWDPTTAKVEGGVHMNLYEINKQIISQLPTFGEEQWNGAKQVLLDWLIDKNNCFYMLYGKEISYFTVFNKVSYSGDAEFDTLFEALKECLCQFEIKAFDIVKDNSAIEIWGELSQEEDDEEALTTCMYLFPYDEGVVTYYE